MKKYYTARDGTKYSFLESEMTALSRSLWADLELVVAGWKARGEEIERLKAYAVAWEMWDFGTLPKRSDYGL